MERRESTVNMNTHIMGYAILVNFVKNAAKKWINIERTEKPKAIESYIIKVLKSSFLLKIATPSESYPPGTWMAAEKVTVAIIVATSKLMLAIF